MGSVLDFGVVLGRLPKLLWRCLGTIGLAIAGMSLAIIIGLAGVVLRGSDFRVVRWAVISFVELVRNTPFLGQILFLLALPGPG